jgi:hypothetical protein
MSRALPRKMNTKVLITGVVMRARCAFVAIVVSFSSAVAWAQPSAAPVSPGQVVVLSNGVEVSEGDLHERITALRADVLRIRVWRGSQVPEDASWAVLASARRASAPVTPLSAAGRDGFRTSALTVEVDPQNLELTVRDAAGNILQQDARPIRWDGDAFRLSKTMPLDEHYFGLGDKTGPLDRRNEAFTLWNTDAYRFQESRSALQEHSLFHGLSRRPRDGRSPR